MPGAGWLAAIGLGLAGALVAAFVLGGPGVSEYPPDTPEAAAQAYIQALFDGDGLAARDLVVPEHRFRCRSGLIEPVMGGEAMSATFVSVDIEAERAVIEVRISGERFEPDPFSYEFREDSRLILEHRDGVWLVADADWPLDECGWR
jgi:hypothetical protein